MTKEDQISYIAQLEGFIMEANNEPWPPGGQQAGMDRSWAKRVTPQMLKELRWYAKCFDSLVKDLRKEWDITEVII